MNKTGLSLEQIEKDIHDLQNTLSKLEHIVDDIKESQGDIEENQQKLQKTNDKNTERIHIIEKTTEKHDVIIEQVGKVLETVSENVVKQTESIDAVKELIHQEKFERLKKDSEQDLIINKNEINSTNKKNPKSDEDGTNKFDVLKTIFGSPWFATIVMGILALFGIASK